MYAVEQRLDMTLIFELKKLLLPYGGYFLVKELAVKSIKEDLEIFKEFLFAIKCANKRP